MGEFDFTYRLPQNFSRRVVQYLEQLESPNVARAFQNCTYDYEDLGQPISEIEFSHKKSP